MCVSVRLRVVVPVCGLVVRFGGDNIYISPPGVRSGTRGESPTTKPPTLHRPAAELGSYAQPGSPTPLGVRRTLHGLNSNPKHGAPSVEHLTYLCGSRAHHVGRAVAPVADLHLSSVSAQSSCCEQQAYEGVICEGSSGAAGCGSLFRDSHLRGPGL